MKKLTYSEDFGFRKVNKNLPNGLIQMLKNRAKYYRGQRQKIALARALYVETLY